jgi:hypothetical protein
VLEREPLLSDNGFKQLRGRRSQAEHEAQFIQWREDIRAPRSLAQFMAARGWLRQFRKIKAPLISFATSTTRCARCIGVGARPSAGCSIRAALSSPRWRKLRRRHSRNDTATGAAL